MAIALVVTAEFGDYKKGDQISDSAKIAAVLASNPAQVVKISVPDQPAAKAAS